MTTAQCSVCGTPIAAGARFCPGCGADVSGQQEAIATARVPSGAPLPFETPPGPPSAPPAQPVDLLPRLRQATLGEYEIYGELGRGGMATVYLAHEVRLDRKVAIKVMSPLMLYGHGMVERFEREARTAAALSHPHIIPIHTVRQQGDLYYFVMKFVEGRALEDVIARGEPLQTPTILTILEEVGSALGYAHRRGVVHRDIKPANIMLDDEGGAVVTDFGIAKVATAEGLTMTGATVGTPAYMSPEQCAGREVTGQSDQYSLGIVAYQMITGRLPFQHDSLMGMMYAHFNETPPPIPEGRPDCPEALAAVVTRMLAKDPADRWPGMAEMVQALGRIPRGDPAGIRANMVALATADLPAARSDTTPPTSPVPPSRPRLQPPPAQPRQQPTTVAHAGMWRWVTLASVAVIAVASVFVVRARAPAHPAAVPVDSSGLGQPQAAVATVSLNPSQTTLTVGDHVTLRAVVSDSHGQPLAGRAIAWSSDMPGVARVDTAGRVEALKPGTATISASSEGRQGTSTVGVTERAVRLVGIRIQPADTALPVGSAVTLRAEQQGEGGVALSGRAIAWSSSDPGVARIDPATGAISALTPGRATVTARAEGGLTARAHLTVVALRVRVAQVLVPGPLTLAPGDTAMLKATPVDARQGPLSDRPVRWSSDNPDVASVDPLSGKVTARKEGTARLTAAADSQANTVQVAVRAPPAPTPPRPAVTTREPSGPDTSAAAAAAATSTAIEEIAAGGSTTCALRVGGGAFCWGGDAPAGTDLTGGPYTKVVAGDGHRCALTTTGEAWCWGANAEGQLGDGSTRDSGVPVRVDTRQTFIDLSAGASHTCALTRDGAAWCWGGNRDGQLGDGSQTRRSRPVLVERNLSYRSVSAGGRHTCGVTTANKAYCWGDGLSGQLGNSRTQRQTEPNEVESGSLQFKVIAVGDLHSCALTTTSRIYCWGENKSGQLGIDSRDSRNVPLDSVASDQPFKDLAAGKAYTCGLTTRGQLFCWGDNSNGQLGDGSRRSRDVPTPVAGGHVFAQVRAGAFHTCALAAGNQAFCWGANNRGQISGEGGPFVLMPVPIRLAGRP